MAAAVVMTMAFIIPDAAYASPGVFPAPATGLLWLYRGTGSDQGTLVQWNLNGTETVTGQTIWAMKCTYETRCSVFDEFAGVAEMDGNAGHDLLTRQTMYSAGDLYLHTNAKQQGWFHWTAGCGPECQTRAIGIRDFNKDGHQDVLWYSPAGEGKPVISLFNGSGWSSSSMTVSVGCDRNCHQEWQPIAVGDVNSDGFHDLLWWNVKRYGPGLVHAWLLNASGQRIGTLDLSWQCADDCRDSLWNPIGLGDMNGDGTQDLLWKNFHSGSVAYWELDGHGNVMRDRYLSWTCDYHCGQYWEPIGIVDPEHRRSIKWP